jgi:hypothetical protein
MKKFINYLEQLQERKKLTKTQLYLTTFGILLFLSLALTLPNYLLKQQQILRSQAQVVAGTTYYVATSGNDANSCSAAQSAGSSKRTIQAGVNCAVDPGDIVAVHTGTYTESVSMTRSGASGNPIRIEPFGYTNNGCQTPGCGSGDAVTWIGGANSRALSIGGGTNSYVRVQGFTFANTQTGTLTTDAVVVHIQNPNCSGNVACKDTIPVVGIEILNNTFSGNGSDGVAKMALSYQIGLYYLGHPRSYNGPPIIQIAGNTFSNNFGYGIISGASSDVRIANNVMTSAKGSCNNFGSGCTGRLDAGLINAGGFCLSGTCLATDRIIVEDNTAANVGNTTGESNGIRFDSCKSPVGVIIRRNTIRNLTGSHDSYGIFPEANCTIQSIDNNVVYNVSANSHSACILLGSQQTGGPLAGIVEHNTLYNCGHSALHIAKMSNVTVRNNIMVNTGAHEVIGVETPATAAGNMFRNNDYWNPNQSAIGAWNTGDYSAGTLTLSQWNSSSGETGDKNADPLFMNASAGNFSLQSSSPAKGAATDGTDMGASLGGGATPTPTPTSPSLTIPGRIEAEDYNTGGEGVGYHDLTTGNTGGQYRTDNVDIKQAPGGGYTVGYTQTGEWLAYTINVPSTGSYQATARAANGMSTSLNFHLEVDGTNAGTISVPSTGSWSTETTATGPSINLTQGTHTLKIVFDADNLDLNYVDFSLAATPTPTPTPTPTSTPTPSRTPTPTPAGDTIKPTIMITSPANGSRVKRKTNITVQATASDNKGVTKVEFRRNGALLCTDTQAPYSCTMFTDNGTNTTVTYEARAYDAAGNTASHSISVITEK